MQESDTLFDYTFQEGQKINLLNMNTIQSEYGISIDQTDHIIKNAIQGYWGTKTEYKVKFQNPPLTVDTSFENILFMETPLIGEDMKQIEKSHGGPLNYWVGGLMYITA